MRAPERIITDRLLLRRPTPADAEAIFSTYSSDPDVTRFVGFARHQRIEDTRAFLEFSGEQWTNWPAGPYLMLMRSTGALIGSSGLKFETAQCAATGYVLAKPAWGQGYATEALRAMVDVARATGVVRLYAVCHHTHRASARVLEKGGFTLEGTLHRFAEFPNLAPPGLEDVLCYAMVLENVSGTEGEMRS
jgi:ribosomal-protein-alanine N-acetyltransferase